MDEKDTHDSKKVKSENTNKNTDVLSRITKYFVYNDYSLMPYVAK